MKLGRLRPEVLAAIIGDNASLRNSDDGSRGEGMFRPSKRESFSEIPGDIARPRIEKQFIPTVGSPLYQFPAPQVLGEAWLQGRIEHRIPARVFGPRPIQTTPLPPIVASTHRAVSEETQTGPEESESIPINSLRERTAPRDWMKEYEHFNTDWCMQTMDKLWNAAFHEYVRDESNCECTAAHLAVIVKEYQLAQVADGLRWLVDGWQIGAIAKLLAQIFSDWVPDLAGYVFSLTCTTWPVRPHIALCASLLLVHEPPKIAAVFVHGLTRNWSPELARSLIAYLDGVLEWDERQFKDFSATYNSCVAQVHEFEQREKECVGINDELEENCDANRISSASGASSNATARKDGVSSVETAWAGHKYALREVTVELANSMVDMNMDTGMRLDEVASLYRSQLTLKDYKFVSEFRTNGITLLTRGQFISDFRIAVAEYQLAVFRHYIECDRCRVGFRCEKVQDMGLSSLNNAAVAAAAAATFYHAFTRDSPGSSFCESSRDLFDRQGSTLSPTDGCTLDSSRSGSGWTRESSFEPWSTATSGISDTEGTRMWVASRSVPSQNTAHQGSDIDVDSRVSTASRRSPTRRESLLSIATNHQNSFVFCDIEHTARLIRERTLAMAEAVLQCSERDRTPNDESGSIRIQSADDGSIEGSNATTQGNPRIRLSPTEASLIGELDPIIGHFLSCDVTDCQECLTAFSLEHPNQLFKLSSASSTTSLTAVPTERVSSELRSSDLSQADSRRVSTASRDGNRGSNTLLEGDTIDRLVQYAARTLSSAGSVFDPSSSARRNINDVQTDSTQHPASVARINTALSRMDLAELIDRAARMPSTLSLFDQ